MYIYVFIFLYFIFNCDISVYLIVLYTFDILTEELPFLKLDDIIFVRYYVFFQYEETCENIQLCMYNIN